MENELFCGFLEVYINREGIYDITIDVALPAEVSGDLKYELLSESIDFFTKHSVVFKIIFPSQVVLPEVAKIVYNNKAICQGNPGIINKKYFSIIY